MLTEYGISAAKYTQMLTIQNGGCAICQKEPGEKFLVVDHDHLMGTVRGLLCSKCNVAIGMLADDPDLLRRAAIYLEGAGKTQ